ncbi:MAG: hypothetical protein JNM25_20090 [Planctomycetes bacterium]|nr:hypothetical protein [Planctomycetota bacterium]
MPDPWSLAEAGARAVTGWPVRVSQAIYLSTVFVLPVLACATAFGRRQLGDHPRRTVLVLLLLDLTYMLWVTTPFVPIGVDETFYAINAHVYAGNHDLWHCWNRPPMTSFGALCVPWHPPLVGLLLRAASAWFAYLLAERAVRAPWALAAPLLVLVASRLSAPSASLLSEPYGAAFLAAFALAAARGAGGWIGLLAGLAFLSRWPLGWLLPVAIVLGWRRQRLAGAAIAVASFAALVGAVLWCTDTQPWRMLGDRSEWRRSMPGTLLYFLAPQVAFGVGWAFLLWLVVGGIRVRDAALRWCVFLFASCVAVLVVTGEATLRFLAPTIPLVAAVAANGLARAGDWTARRWSVRPVLAGLLVAVTALSVAFPVSPLGARAIKRASPQNTVRESRGELLRLVGSAPLYCDCNFLAVTAVLDHKCHAVLPPPDVVDDREPRRYQPPGVGLDLEGTTPPCAREGLPPGAFYLTYDPAGREVLWQRGELHLVRW